MHIHPPNFLQMKLPAAALQTALVVIYSPYISAVQSFSLEYFYPLKVSLSCLNSVLHYPYAYLRVFVELLTVSAAHRLTEEEEMQKL